MKNIVQILVVNQHGENRGDEAAVRGMIDGITNYVGSCCFVLICQFKDRDLQVHFSQDTKILPMLIPLSELPGVLIYSVFKFCGFDFRPILGRNAVEIIKAFDKADIVLSAPGGPYFGDLYRGRFSLHELAHWYMVCISKIFKKQVLLYAPSAGPFEHRMMNIIRRKLYKSIDLITTREEVSLKNLQKLLPEREIHLTADAAIQRPVKAGSRKEFFRERYEHFKNAFIVAVSANDYRYPLSMDVKDNKRKFEECIIEIIVHLHKRKNAHFLFFPQLYGSCHSDVDFLNSLGRRLPKNISWEVVNPDLNSDEQQQLFGICDFCIASRYHPQIFSTLQSKPLIAICYEHKQFGFMKSLDLDDYAFDIYQLDAEKIKHAIDHLFLDFSRIKRKIKKNILILARRSSLTSELISNYIRPNKVN